MNLVCPKCQGLMRQYERTGVTVDQCTECRGIFLDRGELERLVDGETRWHGGRESPPPMGLSGGGGHPGQGHGHDQKRRKRSFLDNLFD